MKVELSRAHCVNVAKFIDEYLLDAIRREPDIDNLEWVELMIEARKRLKEAALKPEEAQTDGEAVTAAWISTEERTPEVGEIVLVIASGKPRENVVLHDAYLIASYWAEEGWIADGYEEWDAVNVSYWMPLPDGPKKGWR